VAAASVLGLGLDTFDPEYSDVYYVSMLFPPIAMDNLLIFKSIPFSIISSEKNVSSSIPYFLAIVGSIVTTHDDPTW
jgi:hypothetical protein